MSPPNDLQNALEGQFSWVGQHLQKSIYTELFSFSLKPQNIYYQDIEWPAMSQIIWRSIEKNSQFRICRRLYQKKAKKSKVADIHPELTMDQVNWDSCKYLEIGANIKKYLSADLKIKHENWKINLQTIRLPNWKLTYPGLKAVLSLSS